MSLPAVARAQGRAADMTASAPWLMAAMPISASRAGAVQLVGTQGRRAGLSQCGYIPALPHASCAHAARGCNWRAQAWRGVGSGYRRTSDAHDLGIHWTVDCLGHRRHAGEKQIGATRIAVPPAVQGKARPSTARRPPLPPNSSRCSSRSGSSWTRSCSSHGPCRTILSKICLYALCIKAL